MNITDLAGKPWAMERAYFDALLSALESGDVSALGAGSKSRPQTCKGVVGLYGIMTPTPTWLSRLLGGTSLVEFRAELEDALRDPEVAAIDILVDSPGGDITGVSEISDFIYAAKGRKPITAYVIGTAASAAYIAVSGASRIYTVDTGQLGSIGVVSVFYDDRGMQQQIGVRRHEIVSSGAPRKRPDLATDGGRKVVQEMVDDIEAVFVGKVARNRGVTLQKVLADFGQGGIIVGQHSVVAGMADGVRNFADDTSAAPAAQFAAAGPEDGTSIEARCKVAWQTDPKVRADFIDLESYTAYEKAAAAGRAKILGNAGACSQASPSAAAARGDGGSVEARCKAAWTASANIRNEFLTLEAYIAFTRAEERGLVRIHKGSVVNNR